MPFVGNCVNAESAVPFGVPPGGLDTNSAPRTMPGVAAIAFAMAAAPAGVAGWEVMAARATPVNTAAAEAATKPSVKRPSVLLRGTF